MDSTPGVEGAWETFATDYNLPDVAKIISREHLYICSTLTGILGWYFRGAWCPHCGESQTFLRHHGSRGTRGKALQPQYMSRLTALVRLIIIYRWDFAQREAQRFELEIVNSSKKNGRTGIIVLPNAIDVLVPLQVRILGISNRKPDNI